MNIFRILFVNYPILLFAVTVHEYAHGLAAEKCGDNTARALGRLTLNPLAHIDPVGTFLLPLFSMISGSSLFFGWAKPVPVNMRFMSKIQVVLVSIAGAFANFVCAIGFFLVFFVLRRTGLYFRYFDGSDIFFISAISLNLVLAVFNLIPIPPLDGSKVLAALLPYKIAYEYSKLEPYGFFIIVILLSIGFFSLFLSPVINFILRVMLSLF